MPGQSGNPGGRPKVARAFKERAREFMDQEGIDLLLSLARGQTGDGDDIRFGLKMLTEYAYGKPTVDVSVNATVAVAYAAEDLELLG